VIRGWRRQVSRPRLRGIGARKAAPLARVPGVDARILDNDGHLTLLEHRIPEVRAWLSGYLNA
jgi:hypothetical protein